MRKVLFTVVFGFLTSFVQAQTIGCALKLGRAEDLYDQGKLSEVYPELKDCLSGEGLSKEQKGRAYKLLTLTYIFLDDEISAEDAMIELFLADPEHPLDETNDPAEFQSLHTKFRSKPIFRLGGYFGGNQSSLNVLRTYTTQSEILNDNVEYSPVSKRYTSGLGFQLGLSFEFMPVKNIEIIVRTQWSRQTYNLKALNINSNNPTEELETIDLREPLVSQESEKLSWASLPIGVRYNLPIPKTKITPYVTGGASISYLLKSEISGDRSGTISAPLSSLDVKKANLRNAINYEYFIGAGIKYNSKIVSSMFLEVKYNLGGVNIVNGNNRYASEQLLFDQAIVDDDFTLNNINVSIGYIWSFYNPVKYSEKKLRKLDKN